MAYQNKHLNTHSQKCISCVAMPIVPNEIDMRYIDNTKEGGKEALEKAVSKIDVSRPGPVPTVPEPGLPFLRRYGTIAECRNTAHKVP